MKALSELSLEDVKARIPFRVLSAKGVVEGTVDWTRPFDSPRFNNHRRDDREWIHVTWDNGNYSMDQLENFELVKIIDGVQSGGSGR